MSDGVLQLDFSRGATASSGLGGAATFVVGHENRLLAPPLMRLLAGADQEASADQFNPLVIVGPSGSGKSHIVQGIVRAWSQRLEPSEIAYFTAADFGRERQAAEADGRLAAWRSQTHDVRLLVLEDVDRLRPRATIQTELRQTIDAVTASGGRVVVTALREPLLCDSLEPGLRDRLSAGLTVRLHRPELPARRAILSQAAAMRGLDLDAADLDRLARRPCATPAQLLGRLNSTSSSLPLVGTPSAGSNAATREDACVRPHGALLVDVPSNAQHHAVLKQLLAVAARFFGVTQAALTSPSRRTSLVDARNVVVYLARRVTELSYADIGRALGGRDHSTIMHAERRLAERITMDPAMQRSVDELERIVRS